MNGPAVLVSSSWRSPGPPKASRQGRHIAPSVVAAVGVRCPRRQLAQIRQPKKARLPPTGLSARPPDKILTDPRLGGTQSGRGHRAYQLRRSSRRGSARFVLLGLPFHGAGGEYGFDGLRFALLLELLRAPAHPLVMAPALHVGIEHFQGSAAGVDLVVMGEIGKAFENAEQVLVPRASPDLHIAGATLRTERPEPRELVTTLWSRRYGEGTERAHHMKEPEAAVLIAAELDANGPIGVVELGLFGRGEIPITDNFEIRRDFVDDRTPLFFEIEPGSRPDLPIATQQPLSLEQRQRQQPGEIFRVDPHQSRVVEHRRRDECDADRRWRVDARRKILQPRQVLHQVIGPIGPNDLFRDADEIAQNAGTLGDRKPALRVNPPRQEVGNPTVRVRVARRADIGPDAAGRAVAADHVEELMRREMRQFVETDQRDLSALPVVNGGFKLQVRKLDLAGARPAPLAHAEVRGPADPWIEV